MGAIALIRTANGALFEGVSGLGKFLRLKFSEMQSSAFWAHEFYVDREGLANFKEHQEKMYLSI